MMGRVECIVGDVLYFNDRVGFFFITVNVAYRREVIVVTFFVEGR